MLSVIYIMNSKVRMGAVAVILAIIMIIAASIIAAAPSCNSSIQFSVNYYFVCYKSTDDAYSAGSISSSVQSYGGAGYIIRLGGEYYVTVACYYSVEDAQSVCNSLYNAGLSCQVVEASVQSYDIPHALSADRESIVGSINSLNQLGTILYEAANAVDSGLMNNTAARGVLTDVRSTLNGLSAANADNALYDEIEYIIALVDNINGGYIYARELRALQIAVCDCILNVSFN